MSELYPYQQRGVEYLVSRGGGFLFDEPGLGKTRQAIVSAKKLGGPVLVVCPNTLKSWWRREIQNIYPNDKVLVADVGGRFGNKKRRTYLADMAQKFPFWVIVHYTGLRLNTAEIASVTWSTVVADECHYVKNRDTQRTKALLLATPQLAYRIGLTATPFGKNPADMWSQLYWMMPESKGLKSYWRFFNTFVDYEMERINPHDPDSRSYRKIRGGKNLEELARIMEAFGIQRTKDDVAPDLPPLTETPLPLDMEGKQVVYYERIRKAEGEAQMAEETLVIPNTLSRMIRLEQMLSHPWTFIDGMVGSKLEWLLEWAESNRRPAVIATHFKESARRIAKELDGGLITGDVPLKLRDGIISRWEHGECRYLVGTIATIGTGLNLQHAWTMVCYDQVYNPIHMEQLKHRIHRVNSEHPVEVVYPYIPGTTSELVYTSFMKRLEQMEFVKMLLRHLTEVGNATENGDD